MHCEVIEEIDYKYFGNTLSKNTSSSLTRATFQNVGPQPGQKIDSKAKQGVTSFAQEKYDVLLFAEHGLYHSRIDQSQKWNINYYSKGSYLIAGFNKTRNCEDWKQPSGTRITITKNIATRKDKEGSGFDPTRLDR